jgi:hypothetical protein
MSELKIRFSRTKRQASIAGFATTERSRRGEGFAVWATLLAMGLSAGAAAGQSTGSSANPYQFRNEIFAGGNYTRAFTGPGLGSKNFGGWNASGTHYFTPLLGLSVDAMGTYGEAPLDGRAGAIANPAVRKHVFLVGPQFRWRMRPRWAASFRLMGGVVNSSYGSLPGTSGPAGLGLYESATKLAFRPGGNLDFNISPRMALRLSNGPLFERQNGGFRTQFSTSVGLVFRMGQR